MFSRRLVEIAATLLGMSALLLLPVVQASGGDDVLIIEGEAALDAAIKANEFLVVEFFAPWCGHCQRLAPEYSLAAKDLKEDGITLASCDMDQEINKPLGGKYGIQGFPTLKVFRNGAVSDYNGPRTHQPIVNYLRTMNSPAYVEVAGGEVQDHIDSNNIKNTVVAFLTSDAHKAVFKRIAEVIRESQGESLNGVEMVLTDKEGGKLLGLKDGELVLIPRRTSDRERETHSINEEATVIDTIKDLSLESFGQLSRSNAAVMKAFSETKRTKLILLVDGAEKSQVEQAEGTNVALASSNAFFIGWIDGSDFPEALSHFGVEKADLPAAIVLDDKKDAKYKYQGNWGAAELSRFANEARAGSIKPFFKSEPIPDNSGKGVWTVVRENWDEVVNGENDVFLKAYAPWCGHCKNMAPAYDLLGEAFKDEPRVVIGKIDGTANDIPSAVGVRGFPTIVWFPKGSTVPVPYQGARTLEGMLAFIRSTSAQKNLKIKEVETSSADSHSHSHDHHGSDSHHHSGGQNEIVAKIFTELNKTYALGLSGWVYVGVAILLSIIGMILVFNGLRDSSPKPAAAAKKTGAAAAAGDSPAKKASAGSKKDK